MKLSILTASPRSKNPYKFDATNKNDDEVQEDVGVVIKDLCRFSPGGVLVFFCSFSYMNACIKVWEERGILKVMEEYKDIYKDLQDSQKNKEVLKTFTENNLKNEKGGIFFSVLRGSASEGIDFSDDIARLVIVIGIPYPPLGEPRVILKKEYLNEMMNIKTINYVKKLNSGDWYTQCATRAVNQAIGRVIRHRSDYGSMVLIDSRYAELNKKGLFSKWLNPSIRIYNNDTKIFNDLKMFFDCVKGKITF